MIEKEAEITRDVQTLHSDMQTLVYENYNKFISATDTVKKVCFSITKSKINNQFEIKIFRFLLLD